MSDAAVPVPRSSGTSYSIEVAIWVLPIPELCLWDLNKLSLSFLYNKHSYHLLRAYLSLRLR